MAFDVTPTAGAGPYLLEAEFLNGDSIDNTYYGLTFQSAMTQGVCPVSGSGPNLSVIAEALRTANTYMLTANVPAGRCYAGTLSIVNLKTSVVVGSSSIFIDNVAE